MFWCWLRDVLKESMKNYIILGALSVFAACNQPATKIAASVEYDDAWQLQTLLIKANDKTRSVDAAHDLTFVVPDDTAGSPLTFEMWGLVGDTNKKAYAKVDVTPVLDDTVEATLSLKLLDCSTPCTVGAVRCDGDAGVATCLAVEGCGVWSQPVACPTATPFCSAGTCAATCTDECTMGTVQCDGTGATKTCGQADADACLDWQAPVTCPAAQTCSGAGVCSGAMMCSNPVPNWRKENPITDPPASSDLGITYDAARKKIVMIGYFGNSVETWTWDGSNWTKERPNTTPPGRDTFAITYDAERKEVVLFSGASGIANFLNDTWIWNGFDWSLRTPAMAPDYRFLHALAYDYDRTQVVMFGGNSHNDTWTWNGINWTQPAASTVPSERYNHALVYDRARKQTVLYGGVFGKNETWVWDSTQWNQLSPATSPTRREATRATYDVAQRKVVIFGGVATVILYDTWTWDGATWKEETPAVSPSTRGYLAYDELHSKVVMFGGYKQGAITNDTWTLDWTCP
jgi:hypothetical protein